MPEQIHDLEAVTLRPFLLSRYLVARRREIAAERGGDVDRLSNEGERAAPLPLITI